jgi:hypothetical protein
MKNSSLKKLIIENFQSIEEFTEIEIKPITLLMGPNSAGKSVIKDAIEWLSSTEAAYSKEKYRERTPTEARWRRRAQKGVNLEKKMRLGAEFTYSAGYREQLSAESLHRPSNSLRETEHLQMLDWEIGNKITLISSYTDLYTYNSICIDEALAYEYQDLFEDRFYLEDDNLIGDDDLGFRLKIGTDSIFWRGNADIKILSEIAMAGLEYPLNACLFFDNGILNIRGVLPNGDLDNFLDEILDVCPRNNDEIIKNLMPLRSHKYQAGDKVNKFIRDSIEEIQLLIPMLTRSLIEIRTLAATLCKIPADRMILRKEDCVFQTNFDRDGKPVETTRTLLENLSETWIGAKLSKRKNSPLYWSENQAAKYESWITKFEPFLSRYQLEFECYELRRLYSVERLIDNPDYIVGVHLKQKNGLRIQLEDAGSGVSFSLPVMLALWGSELSYIEQPELHLHPSSQCDIGDLLVAATIRNNKSIVETHSEHLVLRLLKRVRQSTGTVGSDQHSMVSQTHSKTIKAEDIAIYYFNPVGDRTEIKRIRISDAGEFIDRWPNGFFAERSSEIFDE